MNRGTKAVTKASFFIMTFVTSWTGTCACAHSSYWKATVSPLFSMDSGLGAFSRNPTPQHWRFSQLNLPIMWTNGSSYEIWPACIAIAHASHVKVKQCCTIAREGLVSVVQYGRRGCPYRTWSRTWTYGAVNLFCLNTLSYSVLVHLKPISSSSRDNERRVHKSIPQ